MTIILVLERLYLDAQKNLPAKEEATCESARLQNTNADKGRPERPEKEDIQGQAQADRLIPDHNFRANCRCSGELPVAASDSEFDAAVATFKKVR